MFKINRKYGEKELSPTMPPVRAAFFGLISVFFLFQIGGGVLTILIFGLNAANADVNAMRLLTMGGQILLILFPALLFAKLIYEDVTEVIRFKKPDLKLLGIFSLGMVILVPLLQSLLNIQNYFFAKLAENSALFEKLKYFLDTLDKYVEKTYANLLAADNIFEIIFVLVMVSIVPAICEEIFFRGYVQKSFELKYGYFKSAALTGLFFAMYHFNPYGFIGLLALGVYFGVAAYVTNSIAVPAVLHFINNLSAVIVYFYFSPEELASNITPSPSEFWNYLYSGIILLAIFVFFIYYAAQYYNKNYGGGDDMP